MKRYLTGLAAVALMLSGLPGQQAEVVAPEDLVKDLADEAYKVREAAQLALWGLGEQAVEALEEGANSEDPERAFRCRTLLRRIVTGIGPDTPPQIVELVERYFRGGIETKRSVMERLRDERAFSQVLRLYRFEKDPGVREECEEVVEQVVFPAVQLELVRGDIPAADSLLRLAPPSDANLRRRAALLREIGTLDQHLATLPEGEDDAWRLAMLRASGNVPDALTLAEKLGRDDVVASLSLFQGDPVPFFNWYAAQDHNAAVFRLNAELTRDRWSGEERGAARVSKIMAELAAEGGEQERAAMLSLLLNGYLEEAIGLWENNLGYRDFLFSYYETVELPHKAMEVFGYTGDKDAKAKWRSEHLEGLRDGWDEADDSLNTLLTVAAFLVSRGEEEEGYGIVREIAKVVRKQGGVDEWLEFLDSLTRRRTGTADGYYEMAFIVAEDGLAPDAEDQEVMRILHTLFQDVEIAQRHWVRLKTREDLNTPQRLHFLGGIYGFVHLPEPELRPFLDALMEEADKLQGAARREIFTDLLEPAAHRDDAPAVYAILGKLADLDGFDQWSNSLGLYSGYMGDWQTAVRAWEVTLKSAPNNHRALAKAGAAFTKAGRMEEAEECFRQADLTALDEIELMQLLGEDVYTMGMPEKAEEYYRRLLLTASPRDRNWIAATAEYATFQKNLGHFRVAAAFSEVDPLYVISDRATLPYPVAFLRLRFGADFLRGLALHEDGKVAEAKTLFERCFSLLNGHGLLADDFFPLLRQAGVTEEHDRFFALAFARVKESIAAYPRTHNTYNSAAWLASRASRALDEALELEHKALEFRPKQAAYLDTMAEVYFAMGDREKAIEWSLRACRDSYGAGHAGIAGAELRAQLRRFQEGDFPVP